MEKNWEYTDGLRILLGAGMAAVRTQFSGQDHDHSTDDSLERMKDRLYSVEESLAVLRFKLYEAQEANRAWEQSTGAIRNENLGFRGVIARQKEELAELKKLLKARQREIDSLQTELKQPEADPPGGSGRREAGPGRKSWKEKLLRK